MRSWKAVVAALIVAASTNYLHAQQVLVGTKFIDVADARTIASNGGGTHATLTLTPRSSFVPITCNDTDGCDITMGETGIVNGQQVLVTNVSSNTVNFADSAGIQELSAAYAMGQWYTLMLEYVTDRWVERARSNPVTHYDVTTTLGSDTASISFTSIPATYSVIRVSCYGRLTEAATDNYVLLQFNGDSGSNYDTQQLRAVNTTVAGAATYGGSSARAGDWTAASASTAAQMSTSEITIPNYAGTTLNKGGTSTSGAAFGTSGSNMDVWTSYFHWRSTAAINRVDVLPTTGNLATGTSCSLTLQ